jgi:hypothetical protein
MSIRQLMTTASAGLTLLVAATAGAAPPPEYDGGPGWFKLSPQSTFYRVANDPKSEPPAFFALSRVAAASQTNRVLRIKVYGDYRTGPTCPDNLNKINAVYTGRNNVGAPDKQRRVETTGVGDGTTIGKTYHLGLDMEYSEDWRVNLLAQNGQFDAKTGEFISFVPTLANYIVFSVPDSYFGDNDDPDADLWLRLRVIPTER